MMNAIRDMHPEVLILDSAGHGRGLAASFLDRRRLWAICHGKGGRCMEAGLCEKRSANGEHTPFRVHRHPHCGVPGSRHHLHGRASGPLATGTSLPVASTTRVTSASRTRYVPACIALSRAWPCLPLPSYVFEPRVKPPERPAPKVSLAATRKRTRVKRCRQGW